AGDDPAGDDRAGEIEGIEHELATLRTRLAAAEAQLAQRRRSRLGLVARLLRAAIKDPIRRRTLRRDLARALLDRAGPAAADRLDHSSGYPLPVFDLPEPVPARPELRAAVLLDPVAELGWRYEWNQISVTPDDWLAALTAQPPHLLFAESAWAANGGGWTGHLAGPDAPSKPLRELLDWCRGQGIPSVFWSTVPAADEAAFIRTARLFDHVCTVDGDRIADYQAELGHSRVSWLPFAAQPKLHNPVRRGPGRVYDVAFAGSAQSGAGPDQGGLDQLLQPALKFGLHLYPDAPYPQLLAAYGSYKAFVVANPSSGSKTFCPREVFELAAAQAAVLATPAPGITELFGDDVEIVPTAEEARPALAALTEQDDYRDRLALRAHRRVFDDHLIRHRVTAVLTAAGLPGPQPGPQPDPVAPDPRAPDPTISVVVPTNRPQQLDHVFGTLGRQSHRQVQLVLVQHGFAEPEAELVARAATAGVAELVVLTAPESATLGSCLNLGVGAADGDYLAKLDDDNFYGRHYLRDLVRAFGYTDAAVVGKWAHLVHLESSQATLLRFGHAEHRYTDLVQGGTIMTRRDTALRLPFEDLPRRVDTTFLDKIRADGGSVYSTDRFNFVSIRRADPSSHTWTITEKQLLARRSRLLFYGSPYEHAEV
ncbi:MAG: glycosyltransferase, partial [Sporichthyaceae bacterium]|nr:glycosyltransferase [Sporichthyaceae bacterium]